MIRYLKILFPFCYDFPTLKGYKEPIKINTQCPKYVGTLTPPFPEIFDLFNDFSIQNLSMYLYKILKLIDKFLKLRNLNLKEDYFKEFTYDVNVNSRTFYYTFELIEPYTINCKYILKFIRLENRTFQISNPVSIMLILYMIINHISMDYMNLVNGDYSTLLRYIDTNIRIEGINTFQDLKNKLHQIDKKLKNNSLYHSHDPNALWCNITGINELRNLYLKTMIDNSNHFERDPKDDFYKNYMLLEVFKYYDVKTDFKNTQNNQLLISNKDMNRKQTEKIKPHKSEKSNSTSKNLFSNKEMKRTKEEPINELRTKNKTGLKKKKATDIDNIPPQNEILPQPPQNEILPQPPQPQPRQRRQRQPRQINGVPPKGMYENDDDDFDPFNKVKLSNVKRNTFRTVKPDFKYPIDNNLFNITKNYNIERDVKLMNPKYVNEKVLTKLNKGIPENENKWRFDNSQDIDKDDFVDSVIYNPENQPMVYNGYIYTDPRLTRYRNRYFYEHPEQNYNDYEGLYEFVKNENLNTFVKSCFDMSFNKLPDKVKELLKDYKVKLRNWFKRFVVIPAIFNTTGYINSKEGENDFKNIMTIQDVENPLKDIIYKNTLLKIKKSLDVSRLDKNIYSLVIDETFKLDKFIKLIYTALKNDNKIHMAELGTKVAAYIIKHDFNKK